ncbi:MAG: SLBB domain-containing protein [candidate division Zixibacteria bacterium]|nr:SLBB domain-containing protein [candidate division Zixibacteria bacterium]
MKNRIGFAVLLGFLVGYPFELSAQPVSPEEKKLIQEYLKKNKGVEMATPEGFTLPRRYQTPPLYDSSEAFSFDSAKTAENPPPSEPMAEPDDLRPFGYDIFNNSAATFAPVPETPVPETYLLGPGDQLIVNLWGRADQEYNLSVDREGKIFLPKAGEMVVWGMTVPQFETKLKSRLARIYSNFQVSVMLGKLRSVKVFVLGEIRRPGGYTLSSLSTFFSALYAAGGPTERGTMRKIKILRQNKEVAELDLYDFLLKGYIASDQKLETGDVVYVPVSGPQAKIKGEVRRPAVYELKGNEKIWDLIALSGGLLPTAYLKQVVLDRLQTNDQRELLNLDLSDSAGVTGNPPLRDGDEITVLSKYQFRPNVVWIAGKVKHPGGFERRERMRVRELLNEGEQLEPDAYLPRADIFRTNPDGKRELVSFSVEKLLSGDSLANLFLQDRDSVVVYGLNEVERKKFVSVEGEVKRPGRYELFENMRLSDLVFQAGNLNKNAYQLKAELARVNPGKPSDVFYVPLDSLLSAPQSASDPLLAEDDKVFIREFPDWNEHRVVQITGEVYFPGKYALTREDETLHELIQRAGGLTPRAFIPGISLTRRTIAQIIQRQNLPSLIANTQLLERDSLGNVEAPPLVPVDAEKISRIIFEPALLFKSGGKKGNLALREGDEIYVPDFPSGVQVLGAVASVGTIGYERGKSVNHYLKKAGGFTPNADKKETRLVKASGRVLAGGVGGKKVEPGDAIIVPLKIEQKKHFSRDLATTISIISGVATTFFIIAKTK